jgi:hypothetical protein
MEKAIPKKACITSLTIGRMKEIQNSVKKRLAERSSPTIQILLIYTVQWKNNCQNLENRMKKELVKFFSEY